MLYYNEINVETCHIVRSGLYCLIRENGDVFPCIASTYEDKNSIGNIKKRSLHQILADDINWEMYDKNMLCGFCPTKACRHFRFNKVIEIYNYIDAGLLSVDNVDLPRKVRYRTRSHKKPVRVDKQCHVGRTYEDFEAYLAVNPDIPVVEMDSVEGRKGGKVLLTIYFRNSSLMLAFIRDNNTAKSVTEIFDWLYEQLGHEVFTSLFQVILTDRGSEFTNPLAIEFNKGNGRRTHIFYCDPQRSDQKGGCEVTHEMIRRVLPKKTSFDNLTQDDINLMMSHINSYNRKKLNNQSAHQLFSFINGGDILDKLGIKSIPANEINLTPLLLKK